MYRTKFKILFNNLICLSEKKFLNEIIYSHIVLSVSVSQGGGTYTVFGFTSMNLNPSPSYATGCVIRGVSYWIPWAELF